jgi:nicotinamidase-related amidase
MELVGAEEAVMQAQVLLAAFRVHALPVFHIQHIAKRAGATYFLPGTKGADIHVAVEPSAKEAVITKHFPSSFRETILLERERSPRSSPHKPFSPACDVRTMDSILDFRSPSGQRPR